MSLLPSRFIPAVTLLLALAACSASPGKDIAAAPPVGCNTDAVRDLIGKAAGTALQQDAQVAAGASSVRTLGPNDAATMDYNPQRLNLYTDKNKIILRLACG